MANEDTKTDAGALFEASREAHKPEVIALEDSAEGYGSVLVVPDRMTVVDVKPYLDKWRETPERLKGTARLDTIGALIAHALRFKDDASAAFVSDGKAPAVTVVYDYNRGPGVARWGQHRATFAFPLSREWQAWTALDGKPLDQRAFAEFIEAHTHEVAPLDAPVAQKAAERFRALGLTIAGPSEVLSVSRGISVTTESIVENATTLQTGETRLVYAEKIKGERGAALTIPGAFVVGLPVFEGDAIVEALAVRLRLRVKDGAVTWSFAILGADGVIRSAVRFAVERVRAETGLPVYEGAPEV